MKGCCDRFVLNDNVTVLVKSCLRIMQRENLERIERVDRLAYECGTSIESVTAEEIAQILSDLPEENGEKESSESSKKEADDSPKSAIAYYEEEMNRENQVPVKRHSSLKLFLAVLIADVLFMLFLLYYFHII